MKKLTIVWVMVAMAGMAFANGKNESFKRAARSAQKAMASEAAMAPIDSSFGTEWETEWVRRLGDEIESFKRASTRSGSVSFDGEVKHNPMKEMVYGEEKWKEVDVQVVKETNTATTVWHNK